VKFTSQGQNNFIALNYINEMLELADTVAKECETHKRTTEKYIEEIGEIGIFRNILTLLFGIDDILHNINHLLLLAKGGTIIVDYMFYNLMRKKLLEFKINVLPTISKSLCK
jgi:hypothetical protein